MKVVKNYLYNICYQIIILIIPLITIPYVLNIFGEAGVGQYAFTYANTQYFIIFGMLGIGLYGNKQIAIWRDNKERLKEQFYSIYLIQIAMCFLAVILFILFISLLDEHNEKVIYLAQGVNIIAAFFDISWLFAGLEKFNKTISRNILVKLISLASIFIFVKKPEDFILYILIIGLSSLIGNLSMWLYVNKEVGFDKIKIAQCKKHFNGAIALFIPQITIQVYVLLDRTILGLVTDMEQVGYYDNSQKLVKIALILTTAVGTVMMPKMANTLAKGEVNKVQLYIKNSFVFVSAISFPLALGMAGIAKEFTPWFFEGKFEGIHNLIILSSIIIIAISWSNVIGVQLLIPMNKNKEFTISILGGAITNFILNIIILKYLGAWGACLTTVIAEAVVTIIQIYYIRKIMNFRTVLKESLIFVIPSFIMFFIIRVIGLAMGSGVLTTLIQIVVGAIIYYVQVEIVIRIKYRKSLIIFIKEALKTETNDSRN